MVRRLRFPRAALPAGRLLTLLTLLALQPLGAGAQPVWPGAADPLTGPRSRLARDWSGRRPLPPTTEILVLAGHADSQGMAGSGTRGAAVALAGAAPMEAGITDELFWNLATAREVVRQGQARGLAIRFQEPPLRRILDGDDPRTNWSVGRQHVANGGYALEIHYDAYGPDGVGSGLIPPLVQPFSRLDEALAQAFGGYPSRFRDGLGAPRRGIAILEIGKLEGSLEAGLRDPRRRQAWLEAIARRVVDALETGLQPQESTLVGVSRGPDGERSGPPVPGPSTSPGGE